MAEIQYLLNPSHITTPGAHTAEVITNVPSGSISAVTVQNALNEIGNRNYAGSSSFSGAANSAVKLETARILTIGATGKAFDGSTNQSWSLAEIGAIASSQPASWTPTLGTNNIQPTGVTYSTRIAYSVLIGRLCYIEFYIKLSSKGTGGSGVVSIYGQPYPAYGSGSSFFQYKGDCGFAVDLINSASAVQISYATRDNVSSIVVYLKTNSQTALTWDDITDTTGLFGSLLYIIS